MTESARNGVKPIHALLYDLDGTLIDSMPLHARSWALWHAEVGLPYDESTFFAGTAGRSGQEILRDLLPGRSDSDIEALTLLKETLYRDLAATELQAVPGALALLQRAAAHGLKQAVCTAAPDANVEVAYARFAMQQWIATTVNPEQGFRGKPHPDLFVEAARRLGVAPGHCVVFEDAPLGVEAARRAGMRAVALTTTMPAEAFADFDNLITAVPDFTALPWSTLSPPPGAD